jgi:hypothetical protein
MDAMIMSIVHKHMMQIMSIFAGATRILGLTNLWIGSSGALQKGQLGQGVLLSFIEHKAQTRCLQHLKS